MEFSFTEERILQRAREKSEIQRMVIQGGSFKGFTKPGELKPKEVVSLLLEDEEMERKYNVQASSEEATKNGIEEIDVESSMEGWMSEDLFDMESSNGTSLNTTRAPSPIIAEEVQPIKKEIQSPNAGLVSGRSKRSVKRPPKRFDD